jgi:GTPase
MSFVATSWAGRRSRLTPPRSYPSSVARPSPPASHRLPERSDLAGHERYLKTTLYGLTSGAPSCVFLIVGANAGLIGMSKEHLAIALALNVPVVVCITKVRYPKHLRPDIDTCIQIDMTPPNVQAETVKQVVKILRSPGCRKTPVFVRSMEVAVEISQAYAKDKICPIFMISNVTGEGLDYARTFLNLLPPSEGDTDKYMADQPFEYSVTEVCAWFPSVCFLCACSFRVLQGACHTPAR